MSNNNFSPNFLIKKENFIPNIKKSPILTMESLLANIITANTEKEYLVSPIKMSIWEVGKRISFQVKAFTFTQTGKNIKESFNKDLSTVVELTSIKMGQFMKGNGQKIEKMDSVYLPIQIAKNMKGIG